MEYTVFDNKKYNLRGVGEVDGEAVVGAFFPDERRRRRWAKGCWRRLDQELEGEWKVIRAHVDDDRVPVAELASWMLVNPKRLGRRRLVIRLEHGSERDSRLWIPVAELITVATDEDILETVEHGEGHKELETDSKDVVLAVEEFGERVAFCRFWRLDCACLLGATFGLRAGSIFVVETV